MKDSIFSEAIKKLEAAFRSAPLSAESVKVYWLYLEHIPDDKFTREVELIIRTENFFPSISRLLLAKRNGEVVL